MASPSQGLSSSLVTLDPANPFATAKIYLHAQHFTHGALDLRHHGGVFYLYAPSTSYRPHEDAKVRAELYAFLDGAATPAGQLFRPTTRRVNDVLDAVRAVTYLPVSPPPPTWIHPGAHPAVDLLPCVNGLLHLPSRALLPPTPELFALTGIDFAYRVDAPQPLTWFGFLHQLWPGDLESQELLQEWMGYLLTARTHFQKILLLVGPKRSGKGTIGRVIRALVGDSHVAAPTLASLGESFGLSQLLDKSVALIADARISGRSDLAVLAERLLSISGEDPQPINRKNLPILTRALTARFTIMTNDLPQIEDASGALASRFLLLTLEESFYGREDHQLFAKLQPELPGILLWALDGWDRLCARDRFLVPASSAALMQHLEDLGSPIQAFLRECVDCTGGTVLKATLYLEWQRWCKQSGIAYPNTIQVFAKKLLAAMPRIRSSHPRVNGVQVEQWDGLSLPGTASGTSYVV